MLPIVDAHQHFWRFSAEEHEWMDPSRHRPLMRDFTPEDLNSIAREAKVGTTVSVQGRQLLQETTTLLELARSPSSLVGGVVGWVDLSSDAVGVELDNFGNDPLLKGIRHFISLDPDTDLMSRPAFRRGLLAVARRGLTFDLLLQPAQLPAATLLATALPELPMVLDHMSNPPLGDAAAMERWRRDLARLAERPNVFCKISGYATLGSRHLSVEDLRGAIEWSLECFGAERAMWGSDWPVCTIASRYDLVLAAAKSTLEGGSPVERADVLAGTATRFYSLAPMAA